MKFTRSKAVSFFEDSNIQAKNQLCGSRIIFCKIYDRRTGSLWPISQVGKWNFRLNLSVAVRPFHAVRPFSLTQSTVFFRLSSATNYRLSPLFWLQSDVNCLLVRVPLSKDNWRIFLLGNSFEWFIFHGMGQVLWKDRNFRFERGIWRQVPFTKGSSTKGLSKPFFQQIQNDVYLVYVQMEN